MASIDFIVRNGLQVYGNVGIGTTSNAGIGTGNVSATFGKAYYAGNIQLANTSTISGILFADGTYQNTAAYQAGFSASNVTVTSTTTNSTFYPTFVEATSGNLGIRVDTTFTYNPSTDALTAGQFIPSSSTAPSNGIFLPSANTLGFATNGSERARIDSSGNVGVGTSSVSSGNVASIYGGNVFVAGNIRLGNTATRIGGIQFSDGTFQSTALTPSTLANVAAFSASNITVTATTTDSTFYVAFFEGTTANIGARVNNSFTYNPAKNTISLGNIISSKWEGQVITASYGGTGISSYVQGDLLYASSATTLNTLNSVGTGVGPGNVLVNGALGPTWGSVDLSSSSAVKNTLGVIYGGTGNSTQFTTGSVVFAGASGVYTQDNTNFFWDNTNKRLGLGTASPSQALDVNGSVLFRSNAQVLGNIVVNNSARSGNLSITNTTAATSTTTGALIVAGGVGVAGNVYAGNIYTTGTFFGVANTAINASNLVVTATATNATFYPAFVEGTSGNLGIRTDTSFTYNPSTDTLVLQNLNSAAATALSIDSGTTGDLSIGTSANAKNITIGNLTGATRLFVNAGTGGTTFHTPGTASIIFRETSAPTVDVVQIIPGFGISTSGVNALSVTYVGGAAAIESSATRTDLTASGTSGSTWSGYRVVANGAVSGVTVNAMKVDNITATAGSNNALWIGSGWGNIINLGNSVLIRGDGAYAGSVNNINVISTTTNATFYPAFFEATSGALAPRVDTSLTYNPSTDALTSGQFIPSSSTAPTNGMFAPSTGNIAFSTNGIERVRISTDGFVGIGTGLPASKLQVAGNVIVSNVMLYGGFSYGGGNLDVSALDSTVNGVWVSNDGTLLYTIGNSTDRIQVHGMSTPWQISTATYLGQSAATSTQNTNPNGLAMSPDGRRAWLVGANATNGNVGVYEYDLATPWVVTSGFSYTNNILVTTDTVLAPSGVFWKPDGTSIFVIGNSATGTAPRSVVEFAATIPWSIGSMSNAVVSSFSVAGQETSPQGLSFTNDGTRMFVVGSIGDDITIYDLSIPWNINTASHRTQYSLVNLVSNITLPADMFISPDGSRLYVANRPSTGPGNVMVYQFEMPRSGVDLIGEVDISGSAKVYQDLTVYGKFSVGSSTNIAGNVGIGTADSRGYALYANGNIYAAGTIFGSVNTAVNASNLVVTATATNATFYPAFVEATSGNLGVRTDTGFTYNPSTDTLVLQALNSAAATALSVDSGTTGALNIGTGANAKNIAIGNSTGATRLFVNAGTAGTTFHTVASGFVRVQATAAPTVDMLQITNSGFPIATSGVSAIQISYSGGAAAVESSAYRTDLTPSGTPGSTWNGFRMVGNAAAAGVTMNAIKVDNITASAGSNNALWIGSGWGNIINLGNSVLIRGDGGYAGSVNNINVISTTTNATFYPAFFEATSGALAPRVDTGITYNPSTDALTAGQFIPSSSTAPATGLYLPATGTPAIATTSTERLRIDVNGNVGINQTSPTFRFDVTSNALATTANAQILHARFQNASANADYLEITSTRNQTGGPSWTTAGHRIQQKVDATWMAYIHFNGTSSNIGVGTTNNQGITFGTGGTSVGPNSVPEVMRITNNGDVGIGTNSPVSTAGYKVLTIAGGTGGALELMSGSTSILNISSTSSQATMQTKTTVPLLFGINSAEKMRIASDGNVAIGTTTTTNAALSVQVPSASASPNRSVYLTNGTQWLAHLPNASSGSFNPIVQSGDHALIWSNGTSDTGALTIGQWSSSSRGMRFDQYGNLSIGTSTVGYAINGRTSLTVNGTSQSLVGFLAGGSIKGYIYTDGTNMATSADAGGYTINGSTGLYFQTASAEKMRIDTNGNLTIGASVTSYGPVAIYRSNNTGQYPYITMDVGSTGYRHTSYNTAGVVRWQIGVNNTAETGSNAGSDFFMNTLSDAGAYIATPFRITRSNGRGFFSTELAITETRSDGGQLRIVSGNYGSFWRNDGSNLYLMFTNSGDQYGTWNNLRAFYVSVTTGAVNMSNGATVGSSLTSTGDITTYRSASVGTGALYLGNTGTRYLYYDGTNYNLNAAGLLVGGEVTAYSSDQRLKSNIVPITDAVGKVSALNGVTFDWNERAREFDFSPSKTRDVGVLAQDVERVLPEAVRLAPFDRKEDGSSKSGENYLTVQYEKLTALLIEAVKEQQATIEDQGKRLLALEELLKLG